MSEATNDAKALRQIISGREYCPRCSSGPRQPEDIDECPDCGYPWSGPPLMFAVKDRGKKR